MGTLFYYYHCGKGCKERRKASLANEQFEELLRDTIKANPQSLNLFGTILKNGFKNRNTAVRGELEKIQNDIGKQKQRLKNAKDMVLDGEITSADYKGMKYEIEERLEKLCSEESKLIAALENHSSLVDDSIEVIQNAHKYYKSKDTVAKQRILSSVYDEKLVFEKTGYPTPKPNDAIRLLHRYSKDSKGNNKGKDATFCDPSLEVHPEGVEPPTF